MKSLLAFFTFVGLLAVALIPSKGAAFPQETSRLDAAQLRSMIANMGYEVKDLSTEPGKEKYSFTINKSDLNIPVGAEISPSKNYIWLTVSLKDYASDTSINSKAADFLRQNGKIQPCQFYLTSKDFLMMALPLENRAMDSVILRRNIDKLVNDVANTKSLWL